MGEEQFGPYRLVELVGQGGMAEVWRAVKEGLGGFARTVALKRMRPELADEPELVARFLNEGRLAARLHHANIVDVFDLGEHDGCLYLAMEYVAGRDLDAVLRVQSRRGKPSPGMAAFVLREVCRALEHIHGQRDGERSLEMIHRDVTPNNVMIGWDGSVKLVDFGIARALGVEGAPHTRTGVVMGKSWYVSPEQLRGEPLDQRSDLFSAGIVLHEALTGRRLFKAGSPAESSQKILEGEIAPPSHDHREVPRALDAICMRALARRADQRWASAKEMGAGLDQVLATLRYERADLGRTLAGLFDRDRAMPAPEVPRGRQTGVWALAATLGAAALAVGAAGLWHRRPPDAPASASARPSPSPSGDANAKPSANASAIPSAHPNPNAGASDRAAPSATGGPSEGANRRAPAGPPATAREAAKLPVRRRGPPPRVEPLRRPAVDLRNSDGIDGRDLLDPFHRRR